MKGVPRGREHPVLVFEGAHGSGKTALLDRLVALLDQHVPHARFDFESSGPVTVPEVLSALAFELSRRCPRYGVLRFPRFTAGRLVMRERLDLEHHPQARKQVIAVLEKERNLDTARQILRETAGAAFGALQQHTGVPVAPVGERVPGLILDLLGSWTIGRRLMLGSYDWYGHRGQRRANDAVDELIELNRWERHRDDEDNRLRIDQLLWEAFLADLEETFHHGRQADQLSLNCVVLLDNADGALGHRFLNQLVQTRRQRATEGQGAPDPVSVVATSRGALLAEIADVDLVELTAADDVTGVLSRHNGRQRPWWAWYRLEDLTRDQIGRMVSGLALREGNDQRLATMVQQLTGGHPASSRLLLDAVAERPQYSDDPAAVLDQPEPGTVPDRPTVGERMLRCLLADFPQESFDDLVICATARERQHALRLAGSSLLVGSQPGYVAIVDPVLWPAVEGAGPVLLRRLLLRTLGRRAERDGARADDPPGWSELFGWHREHCAQADDLPGQLYYALADRDLPFVTQRLHDHLVGGPAAPWLALLGSVTSAPRRLPDVGGGVPMDEMYELLREADPPASLEPLARLVASLWVVSDPFAGSRRRGLHLLIDADYTDIARLSQHGTEQLLQIAHRHRRRAEEWN